MSVPPRDALASIAERERRLEALAAPHMAPLAALVASLRERHPDRHVPDADPADGGVHARALLLLEAPGPQSVATGFVSRDSPNATARNLRALLSEASIPRESVLVWNVVPWYVGDGKRIRAVTPADIDAAFEPLGRVLDAMTSLERIVLVGRKAQRVEPRLRERFRMRRETIDIARTWHPSPQVFNISPDRKAEARAAFVALGRSLARPSAKARRPARPTE